MNRSRDSVGDRCDSPITGFVFFLEFGETMTLVVPILRSRGVAISVAGLLLVSISANAAPDDEVVCP